MKTVNALQVIFALSLSILLIIAPLVAGFHNQTAYAAAATGIIVPLYTYPTSSTWDTVTKTKTSYPSVPVIAIINPSNGPGGSKDSNFATGIQKLQSAGVTVLGYVSTSYTSRSSSAVKADIDAYKSWYNSINGIFFDEMSNWAGGESYYKTLNDYAKSKGYTFTVGNPGTDTISSYIGTVDSIIIYEKAGVPSTSYLGGWHSNYDKKNFSIIPYAVSSLDKSYVNTASGYVGYIYITSDDLPNPWDSLPSYYSDLASAVNAANGSGSTSYTATIKSADLNGIEFSGMWTIIKQSDGTTLKTGYTPLSFTAQSGASYQVTVSNYGNYVFDHWDSGSTSSTRTITISKDAAFSAYYSTAPKQVNLSVRSLDLSGNAFSGMWTTISKDSTVVKTGYTTLSYTAQTGSSYQVTVSDYQNYVFDHWEDGSTSRIRTISPNQDTMISAYYSTTPKQVNLTVKSAGLSGNSINGLWVEIHSSSGSLLKTGFTPLSYTVNSGESDTIVMGEWQNYVFDHWDNGNTSKSRTLTLGQDTSITAYYKQ